jgi:hypothetical protein
MKHFRMFLLTTVYLLAFQPDTALAQNTSTHTVKVSLAGLLADLGAKYDRYFTIEDVMIRGEIPLRSYHAERVCPMTGRCDSTHPAVKDPEEELDAIAQDNSNFQYEVDKNNPKIVHVIDKRLSARSDYPMSETIDTVQFEGTTWDFVKYLHGRGVALNYMAGGLGLESAVDVQTKITIKVLRATVRRLLSDFIILDANRSRILWESQTELRSNAVVDVWYPLLMSQKPSPR